MASLLPVRIVVSCCAVVALLALSDLHAQPSAQPLSLAGALERSAQNHPELGALAFEVDAQAGRVRQAGARPKPEVGLLVENVLGTGSRSGIDSAETTLSIGYALEHGATARRLDAANAAASLLDINIQIRRYDIAAETARRFLDVLVSQSRLEQSGNAIVIGEQSLEAVQKRVQAAKVPPAEEARARAELSRLKLQREHAQHLLLTARRRLAVMWGALEPDFSQVTGELLPLPALDTFEAQRLKIADNPEFNRLITEKRLRDAEVNVARLRATPPWQVTAGIRRYEDFDDHALVFGINVPLGNRALAEGAVAEARAMADAVDARSEATRVRLDTELFTIYQELGHAYAEVTSLRQEIIPAMQTAAEQSRYAYERGRYGYMEWAAAQRELLDAERALFEAAADAHRLRIEIERLTGTALGGHSIP
jgi:cobalt-zinc-cadmium efflux system outer membrane protein